MVIFRELRITNTEHRLIIDAQVRTDSIYSDVGIIKVTVGTQKDYEEGVINGVDVTKYISNEDAIAYIEDGQTKYKYKNIRLVLDELAIVGSTDYDIDLEKDLIFIYVETTPFDNPNCPNLPCSMINSLTIGVTLNLGIIYNQFMQYIDELNASTCNTKVPQGLIDFILRYDALLLAADSEHYAKAVEFYNKWFSKEKNVLPSNCGCNG